MKGKGNVLWSFLSIYLFAKNNKIRNKLEFLFSTKKKKKTTKLQRNPRKNCSAKKRERLLLEIRWLARSAHVEDSKSEQVRERERERDSETLKILGLKAWGDWMGFCYIIRKSDHELDGFIGLNTIYG